MNNLEAMFVFVLVASALAPFALLGVGYAIKRYRRKRPSVFGRPTKKDARPFSERLTEQFDEDVLFDPRVPNPLPVVRNRPGAEAPTPLPSSTPAPTQDNTALNLLLLGTALNPNPAPPEYTPAPTYDPPASDGGGFFGDSGWGSSDGGSFDSGSSCGSGD